MVGTSVGRGWLTVLPLVVVALVSLSSAAPAEDWAQWRGATQNGVSQETGLISSWSPDGQNLLWRNDFTGRSTPVVLDGRVFVQGRAGEGKLRREIVAAFDAESGAPLWERLIPTHLTTVPFNRAGWPSVTADRATGYVYAQGIAGTLLCLDRDGNIVWQHSLAEEFGRYSGYGGRTHTPLVDEERLIVSVISTSWGELGPPRHRYFAFDKRSGDVQWISTPGGRPIDLNTTSNTTVAVIAGQRLLISGNADGHLYAIKARTGEKVWSFQLSKRGLNSSPVVAGTTVFIGHSEENIDQATLGRTIAIDATGEGDVTKTHEIWRRDIAMGFPSPMVRGGRVYVMNNSANFYALSAATGETFWEHSLGTVGKSAAVFADGKIFVTEVNGHLHILRPGSDGVEVLDSDQLSTASGRYAELYGSPAIAYGRIYFTTEEGIYCLGSPDRAFEVTPSAALALPEESPGSDEVAWIQMMPADVTLAAGGRRRFEVQAFSDTGRPLGAVDASWSLDGVGGGVDAQGHLSLAGSGAPQAGHLVARVGELETRARVRVFPELPMSEDFESVTGRGRPWWIGGGRYQVSELDGKKVLEKPVASAGLLRSMLLIGPDHWSGYTIEADVMGNQKGRRRTDVGLINGGYILDLAGNSQKLEIRSWSAVLRMAESIPFEWEMGVWYRMKLRVDVEKERALVRGKVWRKGQDEPAEWTLTAEDPLPITSGSPGVLAYSPASVYFDNVKVTVNS